MSRVSRESDPVGRWLRDLVRAAQWHRRLLAGGLLAGAMAFGLHALAPPPTPTVAVVSATRDLPAGARLGEADVTLARVDPRSVPDGALPRLALALGGTVVSAVRRGEVLTDVRLLGTGTLDRLGPGLVATPVRIADSESVGLLRPGSVVDVLAAGAAEGASAGEARLVAAAVRVLTVPQSREGRFASSLSEGSLVLLATTSPTAARLAGAAVTERLSVVVRR